MPQFGVTAAPVGQQLKQDGDGDTSPEHSEQQDVDVCRSVLPVRAVEDKFARTLVWEEGQHDAGDISLAEWVAIEKTLNTTDDRRRLSASWEARCQFSMPDVFCLKERENDQGEQLHLVLAVVRKVSNEATSQLG